MSAHCVASLRFHVFCGRNRRRINGHDAGLHNTRVRDFLRHLAVGARRIDNGDDFITFGNGALFQAFFDCAALPLFRSRHWYRTVNQCWSRAWPLEELRKEIPRH